MKTFLTVIALHMPLAGFAQGEAALPFLLIHSSPEANGWGNIGTSVVSNNAIATVVNPAQLGLFTLRGYFTGSSYTGKTDWLPDLGQKDLTYNALALNGGYDLSKSFSLPFPIGLGIGYSKVEINLGRFVVVGPGGPAPIGGYNSFERAEALSFGLGFDYFAQLGIGMSINNIVSSLGSNLRDGRTANVKTIDWGVLLAVPVTNFVERPDWRLNGAEISPFASITAGYALRNHNSGTVLYMSQEVPDPFPRVATIGLSMEVGITTMAQGHSWKVLTFTLAREAEDLLVTRKPDGSFTYQSGFGDIAFFRHVVQGSLPENDRVNLHRGWQLNLGDLLYIRGGSFAESPHFGNRNYSTSGIGIRTAGLFKILRSVAPETFSGSIGELLGNHFDLAYDRAEYSASDYTPLAGTIFHSITLTFR